VASLLVEGTRTQALVSESDSPPAETGPRFKWERQDYRPAPPHVKAICKRIRDKARELRNLLDRLVEKVEALDLSEVECGFTAENAMYMSRAAAGLEWSVEAGESQITCLA
jgi:hypothetical protein